MCKYCKNWTFGFDVSGMVLVVKSTPVKMSSVGGNGPKLAAAAESRYYPYVCLLARNEVMSLKYAMN